VQVDHEGMTNNTMVFGDDGSISADLAWLWINSHSWPDWRLEVLTAVMPDHLVVRTEAPVPKEWSPMHPRQAFAEAQLDRVVHLTIDADPRLALISRPADLLVVGPRGPGLAKAMHLGSTVEWLLTRPPAPMLVARHGRRTRTAIVCHDGSVHAQAATDALCAMPWAGELEATVLTVEDGRTDVDAAVAMATRSLQAVGVCVDHFIARHGEPTLDLLAYLERHDSDLVVLGSKGLTGVRRLRIGSSARAIAHSTPHSVLLVCADHMTATAQQVTASRDEM
jgi:nucleotide-binding universal stress UspA family protein